MTFAPLVYKDRSLGMEVLCAGMTFSGQLDLPSSIAAIFESIAASESASPGILQSSLSRLCEFVELHKKRIAAEDCFDPSHIRYLVSLLKTIRSDLNALGSILSAVAVCSQFLSVCSALLESRVVDVLFGMVAEKCYPPSSAPQLFLALNHCCDSLYSEDPGAIAEFPFDLLRRCPDRISVLSLLVAVAKHCRADDFALKVCEFLVQLRPTPREVKQITWIMFYLVAANRQNLVAIVDHPAITELQRNLFWLVRPYIDFRSPPVLVPFLQFLFLAIRDTDPGDLLEYVSRTVRPDVLLKAATVPHLTVSVFCLRILLVLTERGFLDCELLMSRECLGELKTVIREGATRAKGFAIRLLAHWIGAMPPTMASIFLEREMIEVFADLVENVFGTAEFQAVPEVVLRLVMQVKSLVDSYRHALVSLEEMDFIQLAAEAIDTHGIENDRADVAITRLAEMIRGPRPDEKPE